LGLAYLGMKAGQNWHYLGKYFHQFDAVIGGVLVLAVVVFVWSRWSHRIRMA
jgi:membrane protein DedA with SNARE-associated domain